MIPAFILLSSVFLSVDSYANHQCLCKEYEECAKNVDLTLPVCFKQCVKDNTKMPTAYLDCIKELVEPMSDVLECTREYVRDGCTNNVHNVAEIRNFTAFVDGAGKKFGRIAKKFGISGEFREQGEHDFNMCLSRCFFIAENSCTEELDCALNMPTELEMITNIGRCIVKQNKRLFVEMATCLETVTKPLEKETKGSDDFDALEFSRARRL